MKNRPEHRKMAKKILDYFEAHPERHDQSEWTVSTVGYDGDWAVGPEHLTQENLCGTRMCVAGTAVFLTLGLDEFKRFQASRFQKAGAELLGLELPEMFGLFYDATNEEAIAMLHAIAAGDEKEFASILLAINAVPGF